MRWSIPGESDRNGVNKIWLPLVMPAPSLCFPSVLCAPRSKPSPQTLLQKFLGSETKSWLLGRHSSSTSRLFRQQLCLLAYLLSLNNHGRHNLLSRFSQKYSGCFLTENVLQKKKITRFFSPNVSFLTHCAVRQAKTLRCHCLHYMGYCTWHASRTQCNLARKSLSPWHCSFSVLRTEVKNTRLKCEKWRPWKKYQTGLIQTVAF